MRSFYGFLLFATCLISFTFTVGTSRAEDSGAAASSPRVDPEIMKRLVTPQEFQQAVPQKAEELYMVDFLKLQGQGNVVVLDVRSKESFDRRHLKGSINAPLTELTEKNLPVLVPDKNAHVVLACEYSFGPVRMLSMTMQAYPVLKLNGYTNIYRLNLWGRFGGGDMLGAEEQEKALAFEGSDVKPPTPPEKK